MAERDRPFELLTPRGHGGVAVVALYGADRWRRVAGHLRAASGGALNPLPGPQLAELCFDGAAIDQLLVVDRPALHCLELHLHGAPAVIRRLEHLVGGFRPPAEDAVALALRHARTPEQVALCLEQRAGLGGFLDAVARLPAAAAEHQLRDALARSRVATAVLQPARLVLCGAQNAGKSTLMNRLLFQARVLTGDLPGLTRDPVSEIVDLDGYSFELVDTAGEGPAGSAADRAALLRARQVRASALRLLVIDGSRPPAAIDRRMRTGQTLVVRSKADLPPAEWPAGFGWDLATSCLDPASAPAVRAALGHALRRLRDLPPAGPVGGVAALDDDGVARLRTALVGVLGAPPGGPADRGSPG